MTLWLLPTCTCTAQSILLNHLSHVYGCTAAMKARDLSKFIVSQTLSSRVVWVHWDVLWQNYAIKHCVGHCVHKKSAGWVFTFLWLQGLRKGTSMHMCSRALRGLIRRGTQHAQHAPKKDCVWNQRHSYPKSEHTCPTTLSCSILSVRSHAPGENLVVPAKASKHICFL